MTAQQVYNRYRALYSVKRLTTSWRGIPVKLVDVRLPETHLNAAAAVPDGSDPSTLDRRKSVLPGQVEYDRVAKCIRVYCADLECIIVDRLSVSGKRIMSAADFHNGFMQNADASEAPCLV